MTDSPPGQQFRINALHGNDVGVFVCEASGILISPCLFMQSICPDPFPRPLFVKWKKNVTPPKSFRQSGTLPLIYSDCGRIPPWYYYLHLFALQLPVAGLFEQESSLQDWTFSVRMIGIVLIFDRRHDTTTLSDVFLSWLSSRNRPATPKKNSALNWVRAQQMPFVIAALGYDDAPSSEYEFRNTYGIEADIPIVPGPVLTDERQLDLKRKDVQASNMVSSVFWPQKLAFDGEYAKTVLGALYRLIERNK